MVRIFTSRLWTKLPYRLDITVKSGDKVFAPTWKMVSDYKSGRISEKEYVEQYYSLMRESYRTNRARWNEVLNSSIVIFCCYCPSGTFCHRYLLKDMFLKLGASYEGEID